jgi:hypothetical protein
VNALACNDSSGGSQFIREDFSPNWGWVVARATTASSDGSMDVGVISLKTGSAIDLTAETNASGFGAAQVTDDRPTFDPVTGNVWFERESSTGGAGQLYSCAAPYTSCQQDGAYEDSLEPNFEVVNGVVLPQGTVTTADGSLVAFTTQPETGITVVTSLSFISGGFSTAIGNGATLPNSLACEPDAWVSATSLLCNDLQGLNQFYLLQGATPQASVLTPIFLIPQNSRTNTFYCVNPSGTEFLFTSGLGPNQTAPYYVAPIGSGPTTPSQSAIQTSFSAIAWQ